MLNLATRGHPRIFEFTGQLLAFPRISPTTCCPVPHAKGRMTSVTAAGRQQAVSEPRVSVYDGSVAGGKTKPSQGELAAAAMAQCFQDSSAPAMVDIGLNLADKSFKQILPDVLARATQANVVAAVLTGTCVSSTRQSAKLCAAHGHGAPILRFTAGVHPHTAKNWTSEVREEIKALAQDPLCVAIGECGLDFNRNFSTHEQQEAAFVAQIQLAKEMRKPLFLHCRDASNAFVRILRQHNSGPDAVKICVHCFTGSEADLQDLLALDAYIGITGWVCDDRPDRGGAALAATLSQIPANRLMIETDAPYLTPRTIKPSKARPHRNEPCLLGYVLRQVAESVGRDVETSACESTATAVEFFGLPVNIK